MACDPAPLSPAPTPRRGTGLAWCSLPATQPLESPAPAPQGGALRPSPPQGRPGGSSLPKCSPPSSSQPTKLNICNIRPSVCLGRAQLWGGPAGAVGTQPAGVNVRDFNFPFWFCCLWLPLDFRSFVSFCLLLTLLLNFTKAKDNSQGGRQKSQDRAPSHPSPASSCPGPPHTHTLSPPSAGRCQRPSGGRPPPPGSRESVGWGSR